MDIENHPMMQTVKLRCCRRYDPVTGGEFEVLIPADAPAQPGESLQTAPKPCQRYEFDTALEAYYNKKDKPPTLGAQLSLQRTINDNLELELAEVKTAGCETAQKHEGCCYEEIPEGCCMDCPFWQAL
jgi:hypothetical protein